METPLTPSTSLSFENEVPKKKRRILRDAENELEKCRASLNEARRKLIITAQENAKMKVLLLKYMDKDDSLLCTSQLSSVGTEPTPSQSGVSIVQSPAIVPIPSTDETSTWTTDETIEEVADPNSYSQLSQMSQLSQLSQWSELSSSSNLEEIITLLEKIDDPEHPRTETPGPTVTVRVGVGVLLVSPHYPGCVLVGERMGSHGAGMLALPGGHLEMFETWNECAVREVKEETDLDLDSNQLSLACVTNDPMETEGKHYITVFMLARLKSNHPEARNMEPHKCKSWKWMQWNEICDAATQSKVFVPLEHLTTQYILPTD